MSERPYHIKISVDPDGTIWLDNNIGMATEIPSRDIPRIIKELEAALIKFRQTHGEYKIGEIALWNDVEVRVLSLLHDSEIAVVWIFGDNKTRNVFISELRPQTGDNTTVIR